MRILGLDPGLAIVGFGVIEVETLGRSAGSIGRREPQPLPQAIDYGIIRTAKEEALGDRLATIYTDLNELLATIQPDRVALEKLFFYRMGNTIAVAQARGVVVLALAQHQLVPIEFTPAQIKQALTGYGNAKKPEVQEAVARELNLATIPRPDDAADALAIALTAWFVGEMLTPDT